MDDGMDPELARAIALSMQETGPPSQAAKDRSNGGTDDTEDEETRFLADMQRAIEASKQEALATTSIAVQSVPQPATRTDNTSFLSDRAKLEQERLARQKRQRPDIDPGVRRAADASDEEEGLQPRNAKRQHISPSVRDGARRANAYHISSSTPCPTQASRVRSTPAIASGSSSQTFFWDGELRQTANAHVDPRKDTRPLFRLTEVLAPKEQIEFAIASAFCWNFSWAYSMFSRSTPVIAVDHSPSGDASIKAILPNWIRTTPFLRNGFGCMHMKFMLLFYKDGRLRIMVSTANLVDYDWRDIENSVWVQDVPKRPTPASPPADTEDFSSTMIRVLHALNVAPALVNLLRTDHPNLPLKRLEDLRTHWDFSRVKAALVPSIAGKHEGWPKVIQTGHTRLMKALIDMHATTPKDKELVLECQGSSIGNYSIVWMNEFYRSARGESTQTWLDTPKSRRAKAPFPPIKILFPTAQYVRESALGEAGGGTMFCRRKQWEGKNFPRDLFHQTRSKRGPVLMHSKMILATFRDKPAFLASQQRASTASESDVEREDPEGAGDAGQQKLAGWVYVGSHNFTPSAWGTLSGTGFNPTLNINNYELGVVIPLHSEGEMERVACWERPPPKYIAGRDEPWMQTESAYCVEDA